MQRRACTLTQREDGCCVLWQTVLGDTGHCFLVLQTGVHSLVPVAPLSPSWQKPEEPRCETQD